MTIDTQLIERIVHEVLARLNAPAPAPAVQPAPSVAAAAEKASKSILELDEAVITAGLLAERLNGEAVLRISARAIVTPSALDALKSRGIACERVSRQQLAGALPGHFRLLVVRFTPHVPNVLAELQKLGAKWTQELSGGLAEAAAQATSVICRAEEDGLAILAEHPARLACRLNRHDALRAAVVRGAAEVEPLRRELGLNVLLLNPTGLSRHELLNILRTFSSSGPPRAPAGWDSG